MFDDPEPSLRVEANYDGPHVTIVVEGELDVSGAGELQGMCERSARETHVGSIDHHRRPRTHVHRLVRPRRVAPCGAASDEVAVTFRISEPSPALRRLIEMAGVPNLLPDGSADIAGRELDAAPAGATSTCTCP